VSLGEWDAVLTPDCLPLKMKALYSLKCWEPHTHQHSATSQETRMPTIPLSEPQISQVQDCICCCGLVLNSWPQPEDTTVILSETLAATPNYFTFSSLRFQVLSQCSYSFTATPSLTSPPCHPSPLLVPHADTSTPATLVPSRNTTCLSSAM
jgi:hypothetical protein